MPRLHRTKDSAPAARSALALLHGGRVAAGLRPGGARQVAADEVDDLVDALQRRALAARARHHKLLEREVVEVELVKVDHRQQH
eukprot:7287726-Prymnesium_polylepis.1